MPIITMQKAKSPSYVTISITPFQKGSDKPPAECDSAKFILTERAEKKQERRKFFKPNPIKRSRLWNRVFPQSFPFSISGDV